MIKSKAGKLTLSKYFRYSKLFFQCSSIITMFNKISFDDQTTLHAWKSELQVIDWTKLVIKNSIQTNSRSKSLKKDL